MVCGVLPMLSIFYQKPSEKNRNYINNSAIKAMQNTMQSVVLHGNYLQLYPNIGSFTNAHNKTFGYKLFLWHVTLCLHFFLGHEKS